MIISLVVAVDDDFGIGKDNQLLCHLPADLRHFKTVTMGKPIIMGRKTFESIGKPLPGRQNIVISQTVKHFEGTTTVKSLNEALESCGVAPEAMIIGGGNLFHQSIQLADKIYLTHIHHHFAADTFFPKINNTDWQCTSEEQKPADEKNLYAMTFKEYTKKP